MEVRVEKNQRTNLLIRVSNQIVNSRDDVTELSFSDKTISIEVVEA